MGAFFASVYRAGVDTVPFVMFVKVGIAPSGRRVMSALPERCVVAGMIVRIAGQYTLKATLPNSPRRVACGSAKRACRISVIST